MGQIATVPWRGCITARIHRCYLSNWTYDKGWRRENARVEGFCSDWIDYMHEKLPSIHARRSDKVEYVEIIVSSQLYSYSPEVKVRCSDRAVAPSSLARALATSQRRGVDQVIECEGHHWYIHSYAYNSTASMLADSAVSGANALPYAISVCVDCYNSTAGAAAGDGRESSCPRL